MKYDTLVNNKYNKNLFFLYILTLKFFTCDGTIILSRNFITTIKYTTWEYIRKLNKYIPNIRSIYDIKLKVDV